MDFHSKNRGSIPFNSRIGAAGVSTTITRTHITGSVFLPLRHAISTSNLSVHQYCRIMILLFTYFKSSAHYLFRAHPSKQSFRYVKYAYLFLIVLKFWKKRLPTISLKLFLKPKSIPLVTYPKAPMAHKKNSKEQFSRIIYFSYLILKIPLKHPHLRSYRHYYYILDELFFFLNLFETPQLLLVWVSITIPLLAPQLLLLSCFLPIWWNW